MMKLDDVTAPTPESFVTTREAVEAPKGTLMLMDESDQEL